MLLSAVKTAVVDGINSVRFTYLLTYLFTYLLTYLYTEREIYMYSYFTISLESCEVYMVFSRCPGGGFPCLLLLGGGLV